MSYPQKHDFSEQFNDPQTVISQLECVNHWVEQ